MEIGAAHFLSFSLSATPALDKTDVYGRLHTILIDLTHLKQKSALLNNCILYFRVQKTSLLTFEIID